jgi:vacuolar-type H+-ATPase subunit I/STV1
MLDTFEIYNTLKEDLPESVASKLATIMGKIYTEVANTVTKEEFNELKEVVRELAEAQKRTEQSLEEFKRSTQEEFQKVWSAINELTEAQKRTEEEIRGLAKGLKETREMVGGLSDTVGYGLEDRIFPYMKRFALKEYGVKTEVLERRNIVYPDGRYDEVNIYAEGRRDGEKVYLIGECKARPGKRDIKQ